MSSYIHYYEVLNNSFVPPLFAEYRSFASRRDTGSGAPNYFYLSPATLGEFRFSRRATPTSTRMLKNLKIQLFRPEQLESRYLNATKFFFSKMLC